LLCRCTPAPRCTSQVFFFFFFFFFFFLQHFIFFPRCISGCPPPLSSVSIFNFQVHWFSLVCHYIFPLPRKPPSFPPHEAARLRMFVRKPTLVPFFIPSPWHGPLFFFFPPKSVSASLWNPFEHIVLLPFFQGSLFTMFVPLLPSHPPLDPTLTLLKLLFPLICLRSVRTSMLRWTLFHCCFFKTLPPASVCVMAVSSSTPVYLFSFDHSFLQDPVGFRKFFFPALPWLRCHLQFFSLYRSRFEP